MTNTQTTPEEVFIITVNGKTYNYPPRLPILPMTTSFILPIHTTKGSLAWGRRQGSRGDYNQKHVNLCRQRHDL